MLEKLDSHMQKNETRTLLTPHTHTHTHTNNSKWIKDLNESLETIKQKKT